MHECDAFEEWLESIGAHPAPGEGTFAYAAFEAGARSRDAEVEAQAETLRESLAALWDLSHQLNRHRCGNWEPELKAADERARAALGEQVET